MDSLPLDDSMSVPKYPKDNEIKVEWKWYHSLLLAVCTLSTLGLYCFSLRNNPFTFSKLFSTAGLYIDFVGVLFASLKTPSYGLFIDSGKLDKKRAEVENIWFRRGMFVIATGILLQITGSLI